MASLNHLIIPSHDAEKSATFITEVLGIKPPTPYSHFMCVEVGDGVTLDYDNWDTFVPGHYAFVVTEEEFDEIFGRVVDRGIRYFADPWHNDENIVNTRRGGRGFYFSDPDGHNMEVLTKPIVL